MNSKMNLKKYLNKNILKETKIDCEFEFNSSSQISLIQYEK